MSLVLQKLGVKKLALLLLSIWILDIKIIFWLAFLLVLTLGTTQNFEQLGMALSRHLKKQYLLSLR